MPFPQFAAPRSSLSAPDCIVVATDLTDLELLLPHAAAQARHSGARIALVHALPSGFLVPNAPAAIPHAGKAKIVQDSLALMESTASRLESAGVPCDLVCIPADPQQLIEDEVEVRRATRVIIGAHGRGRLGQKMLGSVTHHLLSKLDVPVVVVGPRARKPLQQVPARILHPVSLAGYREGVAFAVELAQTWKAQLSLLYVFHGEFEDPADLGHRVEWARTALADMLPQDLRHPVTVHTAAAAGRISEPILKTAAEIDADCIVMGVNAHTPVWTLEEDPIYHVIAGASCPVLSLRHRAASPGAEVVPIASVPGCSPRPAAQAGLR